MNKRGISDVIAAVLIILITIAAIIILWASIIPLLSIKSIFFDYCIPNIITSEGFTAYDSSTKSIIIQVYNNCEDKIEKIKLSLYFNGNSCAEIVDAPEYNQKKTYKFNLSTYETPELLSLSPLVNRGGELSEGRGLPLIKIPSGVVSDLNLPIFANGDCSDGSATPSPPSTEFPYWQDNLINSTQAGTLVKHSVNWTDNIGLSGFIFSFDNGTGTFVNDSFVQMTGISSWSNVTKVVNSATGSIIRWRVYANDSSNNWNNTEIFQYTTSGVWRADSSINNSLSPIGTIDFKPSVFYKDSIWYMISGESGGRFYGFAWNGTNWNVNSTINQSLPDIGSESTPSVFYKDSTWYMISGESGGRFFGFAWNGTDWNVNSTIIQSLQDIGSNSISSVFYKDSTWYMISGETIGRFLGFAWNGTDWRANSTINQSLPIIFTWSYPSVFYKDSTWYMISGVGGGRFYGFAWNGTDWRANSTINQSLPDIGALSSPSVFYKDSTWYMISGESGGRFYGFAWNGTDWRANSTINQSLPDIGALSSPSVFYKDSTWYIISGEYYGRFFGFIFS